MSNSPIKRPCGSYTAPPRREDKKDQGRLQRPSRLSSPTLSTVSVTNCRAEVDYPSPEEIKAIIAHLPDRYRPLLLTAAFTGLRASELRGLCWPDVDLKLSKLHVRQRADRYNKIDKPKSEAGERTIPLPPMVVNTLREWKLRCPKGEHNLVFPTGADEIEHHANILHRGFEPAQIAAGVTVPKLDKDGKPVRGKDGKRVLAPKYPGLHALLSVCIANRRCGSHKRCCERLPKRTGISQRRHHILPTTAR